MSEHIPAAANSARNPQQSHSGNVIAGYWKLYHGTLNDTLVLSVSN
jgi:hypothetical protein